MPVVNPETFPLPTAVMKGKAAPWTANTAYLANQLISNAGTVYTANADYTSGASFSARQGAVMTSRPRA